MKRLLVTGASGLVGGHVAHRALDRFHVSATCHRHALSLEGVQCLCMDLDDERSLTHTVELAQPDVIIHAAACASPDACEADAAMALHRNATATEVLAEATASLGARFILVSTDMVFDGAKGGYAETDAPHPANVYGRSKLLGERFAQAVTPSCVVARTALVYGPPLTGGDSFSQQIRRRLAAGETQPLFTDQFRTPIHVADLAEALLELAENDFSGVIHLGGPDRVDRYAFGRVLAELHGLPQSLLKSTSVSTVQGGAPRPVDVSLDTSLARSLLKTPLRGIHQGLQDA